MKTSLTRISPQSSQRQGGVAVIVMLALLSLILIYITANARALRVLDHELKLTEQRQIHRLKALNMTKSSVNILSPIHAVEMGTAPASGAVNRALAIHSEAHECSTV